MTKGEYTYTCKFSYNGVPYNCDRKVKALFPRCEVEAIPNPQKEPANVDIKIKMVDDGEPVPPELVAGIVPYESCRIEGSQILYAAISPGNIGQGNLGGLFAGSYNVLCAIKNAADVGNTNLISCNGNFGVSSADV